MRTGSGMQGRGRVVGVAATMRVLVALAFAIGLAGVGAQGAAAAAPAQVAASSAYTNVVWTKLGSPMSVWFEAFPHGYVATSTSCWDETIPTIYTSRDGIHWTTPPDPRIFATTDEGFCLNGGRGPVRGQAGYLLGGPVTDGVTTIWQSSDGIRWHRNDVPSLNGMDLFEIAPTRTGYLVGDGNGNYWTSTDGVNWTPAALDAYKLEIGQPGVPMLTGGEGGFSWFSLDGGRTWGETGVPRGMKLLEGIGRLGNVYYGDWEIGGTFRIYSTRNLRHWAPAKAPGTMPGSLVSFGNRLYIVSYDDPLPGAVYSSADGRKWSQVKDPSGHAIQADTLKVVGGRLFVLNGAILWVASLR
jgi:hypothetical protein